jgi:capsular exopolysaccharide synthesis family protein
MSEFFKALGQAERDRALREQARKGVAPPPETTPVVEAALLTEPAPPPPAASARPEPQVTPPVGDLDDDSTDIDPHLVSLVTPATFEAEQYRALRHIVEELHANAELRIIAVSSPSVGDGKTTTAINLAGALAQSAAARVLLVDADLRAPAVEQRLALRDVSSPGLVGAIIDSRISLADAVRRRPPFALDVLPAGDRPTAPYELLKSRRLAELFQEARRAYDYVVVDTPPLVGVPDCRVLASVVDGFIIIVAAHQTPKRLVEEALTVVEAAKTIGLVFNEDDRPLSGYYSREYGPSMNGNGHRKWRWGRR